MRSRSAPKGFTLLECLLAVALLAAALPAICSVLDRAVRDWRFLCERASLERAGQVCLERMEGEFRSAIPLRTVPFSGRPDSLSCLTWSGAPDSGGHLVRVTYRREGPAGPWERVVRRLDSEAEGSPEKSEELPGAVRDLRFSFPIRKGPEIVWGGEWESGVAVPQGVRIRLSLQGRDSGTPLVLEKTVGILDGRPTPSSL